MQEVIAKIDVDFYVGFYGEFEKFGLKCALEYKKNHNNAKVFCITPYLNSSRYDILLKKCDGSIYPEIETVPPKFAIIKRNEWVIDKSDIVIFYMEFSAKKTYDFYLYAKRKNKRIINLANSPKL